MRISAITNFFKNRNRNYVILAQVINAIIALISGKLIAIFISPEDFGTYNLQWAAFIFFSTIFIVPLIQHIKATGGEIVEKIGTRHYLVTGALLIIITIVAVCFLINTYYGSVSLTLFFSLLLFVPLYVLNSIIANHLNIGNRIREFCFLSILKTLGALLGLVFLITMSLNFIDDSEILWIMQIFGALLGLVFFRSNKFVFAKEVVISYHNFIRKYSKFALPLMFMAFWAWISNYFDRYAIEYFLTLKDVGVYNASYSLGSKFFLVLSPIFMVLLNPIVFSKDELKSKKKSIKRFSMFYTLLAIPILIIIFFSYNTIGALLLAETYAEGFYVIFLIAIAFFVFTMTQMIELIFYHKHRTRIILYGNIVGAFGNIVFNLFLIPRYHIFGAAAATLIGFMLYFMVIVYFYRILRE